MFTGIVTHLGCVRRVVRDGDVRMEFQVEFGDDDPDVGASVACSGACLTVVDGGPGWFAATVSRETLACTTLGRWREGTPVNFERSLKLGDELGGHMLSGHVDGVALIAETIADGDSLRLLVETPERLARFVAAKGSVALDGVSLTVNEVDGRRFSVNIIPHTRRVTTLGDLAAGDGINLEVDVLARYVARFVEKD